jgi:cytochrome c553
MKKVIILATSLLLVGASVVRAEGDAQAGQAKAAACGGCHGADGNNGGGFPKLAGQNAKYTIKQLKDMMPTKDAKGNEVPAVRPNPVMTSMLTNLTEQDIEDIAAYYASQKIQVGQANKELVELGQKIYRGGDQSKGLAACTACHSPTGQGNAAAGFPALGGQHADYIEKQLRAFRADGRDDSTGDRRTNDPNSMMRMVAAKLSDKEISAVSSYISGLH